VLADTVTAGPLLLALPVAMFVGVMAFLSPCVIPLVPGYLSFIAGTSGSSPSGRRWYAVVSTGLFVAGFGSVFVAQGFLLGAASATLQLHHAALQRAAGVFTIGLGVVYLGALRPLQREVRLNLPSRAGMAGAPLLGFTFALGWTPCLGPTLSAVLGLAAGTGSPARGALLGTAYCLGLGIPFIALGAGATWLATSVERIRRHQPLVTRIGGGLLVTIGVLLFTGAWDEMTQQLQTFAATHLPIIGSSL
jgi:cytochrome c-type biogenesis protein